MAKLNYNKMQNVNVYKRKVSGGYKKKIISKTKRKKGLSIQARVRSQLAKNNIKYGEPENNKKL